MSEVSEPPHGRVTAIHIARGAGRPMSACETILALAGKGLVGDRYASGEGHYSDVPSRGGGREVTFIARENLERVGGELGLDLTSGMTRRNITTEGVDLDDLIGRTFVVGEVRCEGVKPCRPCGYLDEVTGEPLHEGLRGVGGLRANVLSDGTIRTGDPIVVELAPTDRPSGPGGSA